MPAYTFTRRLPEFVALDISDLEYIIDALPSDTYFTLSCNVWRWKCANVDELVAIANKNALERIESKHSLTIRCPSLHLIISLGKIPVIRIKTPTNEALGIYARIALLFDYKQRFPYRIVWAVFACGMVSGFSIPWLYSGVLNLYFAQYPALLLPLVPIGLALSLLRSPRFMLYLQKVPKPAKLADRISLIAGCISAITGLIGLLLAILKNT